MFVYEQLQGRQFLPAAAVDKETGEITFFLTIPSRLFVILRPLAYFFTIVMLYDKTVIYTLQKPIKRRQGSITWKP